MAPLVDTSFEDGLSHADLVQGAVSVDGVQHYGGVQSLRLASDASKVAEAYWVDAGTLGAGRTVVVGHCWFLFSRRDTDFARVFYADSADGQLFRLYVRLGSGAIIADLGAAVVNGPVIPVGVWARLDWRINVGNTQHTLDWKVNGVDQPQALTVGGLLSSMIADVWAGSPAGVLATLRVDDLQLSVVSGDYPLQAPMYFRPPTYKQYHADPGQDRLMSRVPFDVGKAVVGVGGVLTPFDGQQVVRQDEAAAATHVYMGGFVNGPLTAAEVANLQAAGYGAFLSTTLP